VCVCVRAKTKAFLLTHICMHLMATVNQKLLWINVYFPVDMPYLFCTYRDCMSVFISLQTVAQGILCIAFALNPASRYPKYRYVTCPVKSTTTLALSLKTCELISLIN
jgi:hypothetical protein